MATFIYYFGAISFAVTTAGAIMAFVYHIDKGGKRR